MSVEETSAKLFGEPPSAESNPAPSETPAAPETPAVEQVAETPPVPQAPVPPTPPPVPISALLDEREKRQAAERRAAQLEAWRQEQERKAQEAAAQRPNMLDDPEGYDLWWENRVKGIEHSFETRLTQAVTKANINSSMRAWKKELGAEKFNELYDWTATMPPQWIQWAEAQDDPFGVAHDEWDKRNKAKRAEEIASKLGGKDLEAYLEEQKQAWLAENAPQADGLPPAIERPRTPDGKFASTPSPTATPHKPPSLNAVNGAPAPRGNEQRSGYEALFGNK